MRDSDTVEDASILEGTAATGSLDVKESSVLEEEAGTGDALVPRRMLELSVVLLLRMVLLLWPTLALRKEGSGTTKGIGVMNGVGAMDSYGARVGHLCCGGTKAVDVLGALRVPCYGRCPCARTACFRAARFMETDGCIWKPLCYGDKRHSEQCLGFEDSPETLTACPGENPLF